MANLEKINNITERPIGRLLSQFQEDEAFVELVEVFIEELYEVQNVLFDICDLLDLTNIAGQALDVVGKILDEKRQGDDDSDYRERLRLKIYYNSSTGTEAYVRSATKELTGGTSVILRDEGNASLRVLTNGPNLSQEVQDNIQRVVGAGIEVNLASSLVGEPFVTVDMSPSGPNDFNHSSDTGVTYKYYDDPDGKGFQDYKLENSVTLTISDVQSNTVYSVRIDGITVLYTSSSTATGTSIALGLANKINDLVTAVTATPAGSDVGIIGTDMRVDVTSDNMTAVPTYISMYGGIMVDLLDSTFPPVIPPGFPGFGESYYTESKFIDLLNMMAAIFAYDMQNAADPVLDRTNNNIDGVYENGLAGNNTALAEYGKSADYDGVADNISVSHNVLFNTEGNLGLYIITDGDTSSVTDATLFQYGESTDYSWKFAITNNKPEFLIGDLAGSYNYRFTANTAVSDMSVRHTFGFVFQNGVITILIDGVPAFWTEESSLTSPSILPTGTGAIQIGSDGNSGSVFDGLITWPIMWDYADSDYLALVDNILDDGFAGTLPVSGDNSGISDSGDIILFGIPCTAETAPFVAEPPLQYTNITIIDSGVLPSTLLEYTNIIMVNA